jgi:hypothetical protein
MMLLGKVLLFFQRANNSSPVRRIVWNCDFWTISNSTGISFVQKEERRMVEAPCSGLTSLTELADDIKEKLGGTFDITTKEE